MPGMELTVLAVTISGDMITAVHHDFLSLFAILYLFLQFAVRVCRDVCSFTRGNLTEALTTMVEGECE